MFVSFSMKCSNPYISESSLLLKFIRKGLNDIIKKNKTGNELSKIAAGISKNIFNNNGNRTKKFNIPAFFLIYLFDTAFPHNKDNSFQYLR